MSTRTKRLIILITLTFGSFSAFWAVMLYQHNVSEGGRIARINLAIKHAEHVSLIIAKDRRFDSIRVSELWGEEARLGVSGFVNSNADLQALHLLVDGTKPPVPVEWRVEVDSGGAIDLRRR